MLILCEFCMDWVKTGPCFIYCQIDQSKGIKSVLGEDYSMGWRQVVFLGYFPRYFLHA